VKILVTGGTGLVGERLLPRLAAAGMDCHALVRPGKTVPRGIVAVHGDLFDPASLAHAVGGVSAIVHLAAVFRTQDTDLIWKSNFEGTRDLIAAAQTHAPQARFILASTSNVYARDGARPARESDPVAPTQAYPASKAAAEQALAESGLNASILRFPFIYGDGDGHLEMLPQHVGAFGFHPAHRMSTLHHRDIATAIEMALAGAFDGRTVNLADDAPLSIWELVALAGGEMAPSSEPTRDPWFLHVDAALARNLGFRPEVRTVYQAAQEGLL
jgi:nucleoside-diphosphate-sugar epimerase